MKVSQMTLKKMLNSKFKENRVYKQNYSKLFVYPIFFSKGGEIYSSI